MDRKKKLKVFFKLAIILTVSSVILISIFLYITLFTNLFLVKSIDVKINGINCTDSKDLQTQSQITDKNLFSLNEKEIESKLKRRFLCIDRITFSKKIPDRIELVAFVREPKLLLINVKSKDSTSSADAATFSSTPSATEEFLSDKEGVVFAKDKGLKVNPRIFYMSNNLTLGSVIEKRFITKSLEIFEGIKSIGIESLEGRLYANGDLVIHGVPKLIFNLGGDTKLQLVSLQLIIRKATIEEKEMEFIDLRFENPVVRYNLKKK